MAHSTRSPQHDAHHSARTKEQLSKGEQQFQHHHGTPAPGTTKPGEPDLKGPAPSGPPPSTPPDGDCSGM